LVGESNRPTPAYTEWRRSLIWLASGELVGDATGRRAVAHRRSWADSSKVENEPWATNGLHV